MYEDIFIQVRYKLLTRINSKDILLIEADGNYSKVTTTNTSYLVSATLTQIEADLPQDLFCRVHRAYIVPLNRISDIDADTIYLDNKEIPIAKKYKENLFSRLKILR
ncbi:two-component system, LytT family, response regulator [Chitinophaga sp. YR573]|uniref:LytR/AlgR family response regulator transcription factor n=1 Tax=Chitinophaga sp. YR573 TaxID=1881040 RepID=UPI0008D6769B|nr:LytTR family DNA-binding domain-containing protein [Chitinophaga sp. YR573]SEW37083.1 two-component system, LytT family, response regulator [Chitinophaga sp. YR573]